LGLRREATRFARYEAWISSQVDRMLVMSDADASALRRLNPVARVSVIPNGVDTYLLRPGPISEAGRRVLFVGSPQHPPNLDAARWLLTEIWPALHHRCPDATLTLVNMDVPPVSVLAAAQPGVRVTSQVSDVVPYYRQADLCLVPLRIGSGTRLKILEAMALGVPVLTTQIGAEGLEVVPGLHVALAESTEMLVAEAANLLAGAGRRYALALAARKLVEERYDWDQIVKRLEAVYSELLCVTCDARDRDN
jgi:glycosyltransferase involved in cell wall biosynthesis